KQHDENVLCPFGFLGFRYAIEQLSSTDRIEPPIVCSPRCDFAVAETQYDLPDPKALEAHIDELRALGNGANPPAILTEAKDRLAVKELLGRDLSLVYFFCHGNRARAGGPDTYLAVGNDEVIKPEDLGGWFNTWMTRRNRYVWDDVRPLVFINACHSVAVEPETLVTYLDVLFDRGHAAGVIGTEVRVEQALAMDVATR